MKDVELRGLILEKLYEKRSESMSKPVPSDFSPTIGYDEISRICMQLKEYGLVHATLSTPASANQFLLRARITARGVDVIESGVSPDFRVDLPKYKKNNNSSLSSMIGANQGRQLVRDSVSELARFIDSASGTLEEKMEAKRLLKSLLEHPLLLPLGSAAISLLD